MGVCRGATAAAANFVGVVGRVGFRAGEAEVGAFLLEATRALALGFFTGAGVAEGAAERDAGAAGSAGRRGESGARAVDFGSASRGRVVGAGTTIVGAGTAFMRRALLLVFGDDFSPDSFTGDAGGAVGPGVGALLTAERFGLWAGVSGPTGAPAAAGLGAGGGGVGTGSFFPVRGERDLGGMSRTLGDADDRVGFRSGASLNWLSQAAQTVFPKVLI